MSKKTRATSSTNAAPIAPSTFEWTPPSATCTYPVLTLYVDPMIPVAAPTPHVFQLVRQAGTHIIEVAEEAARRGKPIDQQVVLVADLRDRTAQQLARVVFGAGVMGMGAIVTFERLVSTLRQAPFGPREVAESFFTSARTGCVRVMVITDGHWYPMHVGLRHAGCG